MADTFVKIGKQDWLPPVFGEHLGLIAFRGAMMEAAQLVFTACVMILTAAAVVCDVRTNKLPNWLTVSGFCSGVLFHAVDGFCQLRLAWAGGGLLFSLGGFATGFGILFVLWLIGASGGGDVKFMGALGAWLGAWMTFQVLVASALFAGVCTLGLMVLGWFGVTLWKAPRAAVKSQAKGKKTADSARTRSYLFGRQAAVPYGVPAALATWSVLVLQWTGYAIPWPPSL